MTATSPPLLRRAAIGVARRWRRLRYANTVSRPYLSGDLFRSLCDAAFDEHAGAIPDLPARLETARSIFVKTDRLPDFLRDHASRARACRVLITGNSDAEIHDAPAGLPPNLRRWFAQNTFVATDRIRPLPIGLENQALGRNGVRRPRSRAREAGGQRLRVFAAFDVTHVERTGLLERLAGSPMVDVERRRLPSRTFQARLGLYRFVAAPRGNGIDTHRFWEALYADAIPVTRATPWSRAMQAEGVPMLAVDDWDRLLACSEDDLARWSAALPDRPSAMPWLWEPYWRARVEALVADEPLPPGRPA